VCTIHCVAPYIVVHPEDRSIGRGEVGPASGKQHRVGPLWRIQRGCLHAALPSVCELYKPVVLKRSHPLPHCFSVVDCTPSTCCPFPPLPSCPHGARLHDHLLSTHRLLQDRLRLCWVYD
jgi:hypothetical protein